MPSLKQVWYDSLGYDVTDSSVWHDSLECDVIRSCALSLSSTLPSLKQAWYDSLGYDMTHSSVWHDSRVCDMSRSCALSSLSTMPSLNPGRCHTCAMSHVHCNTLQHTAAHCNILQHTATHCSDMTHSLVLIHVIHVPCRTYTWDMTHPLHITHNWVIQHLLERRQSWWYTECTDLVTSHNTELCRSYEWVTSHTSESCHTNEWIMSHTRESCHTCLREGRVDDEESAPRYVVHVGECSQRVSSFHTYLARWYVHCRACACTWIIIHVSICNTLICHI